MNDDLPGGWRITSLADCVDILDNRRVPVNSSERAKRPGPVPYYGATGRVGWIDDFIFDEELVLIGEDGAPFLDKSRPIAYLIHGKSWVNNHAHVLRARPGATSNQFIKYYLDSVDFTEYVNGTTRLKLTKGALARVPVTLPPLPDQKRIVERIDALLAKASAARERLTCVRDILKRFRYSVLAAACSGRLADGRKLDRQGNDKFDAELPPGWRAACLGDTIVGFESGRSLSGLGRAALGTEIGVLRISAVTWGEFRSHENKALPRAHEPRPHELVRGGDLLITRANTSDLVGAVALVPDGYSGLGSRLVLPDKILRIVPEPRTVMSEYLLLALRTREARLHFAHNATGTSDSMRNLSQPKIEAVPIALPPLAEQAEIVRSAKALFAVADAVEKRLVLSASDVDNMPAAVLAKAFAGDLTMA